MANTPDILKKILRQKVSELQSAAEQVSLREISVRAEAAPAPRGFQFQLQAHIDAGRPAVIAEVKRASPSAGIIREPFEPDAIARSYESGGASALSVLTDVEFFKGAPEYLSLARSSCNLPALRKDFIVDQYQIYEARALGADAILLIVSALGDAQLIEFAGLASHLGMDTLVEVHDEAELERALAMEAPLIGINNRNLHTFETRLDTTIRLREQVPPDRLLVTESGIHTSEDVALMLEHGVHCFLVGEAFMRADDPGSELARLFRL